MASTYSTLKFELIGTGEQSGTWGNTTNTNLGTAIQEAITGSADVTFASGTVTLTLTDTNTTQTARNLRLNLIGTSGGAQNLIVPAIEKFYLVNNGVADAITVKNSTGTGIAVPAGKAMLVFNDGTNVVEGVNYITALQTSTATIGTLTLTNDLTVPNGGTGASTLTGYVKGNGTSAFTAQAVPIPVADGGTGATTLTANNVILGNGTSAPNFVAPSTSGNVLTSNGTTWTSAAAAAFDTGTRMIFAQNAAPTGWTKDTTNYNQHAMRIVTGTAGGAAGSVDFTTAFASQTPTGSVAITAISGSAGATTLTTPQIPSHTHSYNTNSTTASAGPPTINPGLMRSATSQNTGATGGGGSHDHPFSFSSGTATFSGTAINLAVKYLDVMTATKD
jgi:hypothetical protein